MSDQRGGTGDAWRETTRRDDGLPWLESAGGDYDAGGGNGAGRGLILFVVAVAIIGAAVFAWWFATQSNSGPGGSGALIAAPEGDYKTKPDQPGGMTVAGKGDQIFVTSEGGASNGSVDLGAVPEAPVQGTVQQKAPTPEVEGSRRVVANVPQAQGRLEARAPVQAAPPTARGTAGGSVVQLGSFPSEGGANGAWTQLSGRFSYLAPLGKAVEKAEVNGRTVFRLRVNAGSAAQARELCGRLKVAGEPCFVAGS